MMPSPTICLGSIVSPFSVAMVLPPCSTPLCVLSVPASTIIRLALPLRAGATVFKNPMPAAEPKAIKKSFSLGVSLPSLRALSFAIGPRACTASKMKGPDKPPITAPVGPKKEPNLAPVPAAATAPPYCGTCSTIVFGKYLNAKLPSLA